MAPESSPDFNVTNECEVGDTDRRRLDLEAKQQAVARLLHDTGCEGLLVLLPANFRWLTCGANPVGLFGRDEVPGLFFNAHQRWLLASSTDSPRFFREELDGLGFQLKEWHWTASREQLLADLVFNRKVAADTGFGECKNAGRFFASERRKLSPYEADKLEELGTMVAHAVEATARNLNWGDPEEEVAGHLAHRLMHHLVEPVSVQVSGGDAGREFHRRGYCGPRVESSCVLQATGRKFGLHATASRTVYRRAPEEPEKGEFDIALRWRVAHLAGTQIGEPVASTLNRGRAMLRPTPFEHEWRASPTVMLTGREPSEGVFVAGAQDRWLPGWAAVWQERIGAAALVDTYRLGDEGWVLVTQTTDWPIRRAMVADGHSFDIPDRLIRDD